MAEQEEKRKGIVIKKPIEEKSLSMPVGFTDPEELYKKLKDNGILVRHFSKARIKDYVRITVGTREQMEILLNVIKGII